VGQQRQGNWGKTSCFLKIYKSKEEGTRRGLGKKKKRGARKKWKGTKKNKKTVEKLKTARHDKKMRKTCEWGGDFEREEDNEENKRPFFAVRRRRTKKARWRENTCTGGKDWALRRRPNKTSQDHF